MKHKIYQNYFEKDERVFYQRNNVRDLFDKKRFKPKNFKDLKSLTGDDGDKKALYRCVRMFKYFIKLVADDMVNNRDAFIFPFVDFGYMSVADTTDTDSPRYRYNHDTEGRNYTGRIYLTDRIRKYNKKHYCLRLNRTYRKQIFELVKNGLKY